MSAVRLRGERVAELREAAGLSQGRLAELLGVRSRTQVWEWERGEQQPQPRVFARLAAVLEVDPLALLDVDAEDPPLAGLRLAAGLSLQELATASGLSYSTLRRLESGGTVTTDPRAPQALAAPLGRTEEQVRQAVVRSRAR